MIKKIYLLLIINTLFYFLMEQSIYAQQYKPQWINGCFVDLHNSYISVCSATGYDSKSAKDNAFKQLLTEKGVATGTETNVNLVGDNITVSLNSDLIVKARIIDEYIERIEPGLYKVYLLAQIAKNPIYTFDYVEYTDRYPLSLEVLFPGMMQFNKGQTTKGLCIITGEVFLLSSAIVSQYIMKSNIDKIDSTHDSLLKYQYSKFANTSMIIRNTSIACAIALYIWNIIDAVAVKGEYHIIHGKNVSFHSYSDLNSMGITLNFKF